MGNTTEISSFGDREDTLVTRRSAPQEGRTIRRVLVCIDQSPFSEACLRHAIAISKSLGSAITLLHVMEPTHARAGQQATDVLDWEISRQEAKSYLARLEQEGTKASGHQVETRLEQGHPADRIASVARELDADLTILGSQGEHDGAAWNLGSTVQQVLAVTRGSVFIARSRAIPADALCPKRILIPLDGSLRTECVFPTAVRIAKACEAELLLALVVADPVPTAVLSAPEDLSLARLLAARLEVSAKRYLDGLREQLVREGASARTLVVRSADERQSLLELSRTERSDLVILSAHGSTCNPTVTFGSVTAHLLTHSTVPLLVLQDLRDSELRGHEADRHAPRLRASFPPEGP